MEEIKILGKWGLENNDQFTNEGYLVINDSGFYLEIKGSLGSDKYNTLLESPLIYGIDHIGRHYVLFDALWIGSRTNICDNIYRIQKIYIKEHGNVPYNATFLDFTIIVSSLTEWFNTDIFSRNIFQIHGNSQENNNFDINYSKKNFFKFHLEDLEINLDTFCYPFFPSNNITLKTDYCLSFRYIKKKSHKTLGDVDQLKFDETYSEFIEPILLFLTFASNRLINMINIEGNYQLNPVNINIIHNFTTFRSENFRNCLFHFTDIQNDEEVTFEKILENWLSFYHKNTDFFSIYFDSLHFYEHSQKNIFLNLISGFESYFSVNYPNETIIESSEFKKLQKILIRNIKNCDSLNDSVLFDENKQSIFINIHGNELSLKKKFKSILDKHKTRFTQIDCGKLSRILNKIVDTRNDFVHPKVKKLNSAQEHDLDFYNMILRYFLDINILYEIGFADNLIEKIWQENSTFNYIKALVDRWD